MKQKATPKGASSLSAKFHSGAPDASSAARIKGGVAAADDSDSLLETDDDSLQFEITGASRLTQTRLRDALV